MTSLEKSTTAEERVLQKRLQVLRRLEKRLAQRELDLATLRAELKAIDLLYIRKVGKLLAQIELVDVRITELLGWLNPEDAQPEERTEDARRHAAETRRKVKDAQAEPEASTRFRPSETLRSLYREAAKNVHPDLALEEKDREVRNNWMIEINAAYQAGDEERLSTLLKQWRASPESIQGDTLSARLERTLRMITRAEERLKAIQADVDRLEGTFAYRLRTRMRAAEKEGRDLLSDMAEKIERKLERKQSLLDALLENASPEMRARSRRT